MTDEMFWVVMNPEDNAPKFMHRSESSATTEAERLARKNPGQVFYVMESICGRVVDDMQRIQLRQIDDIPF